MNTTTGQQIPARVLTAEERLGNQWQWFLYILLGSIGQLGLRRVDEGFWLAWGGSRERLLHYVFLAGCLFSFLTYDVGALAVLTNKFPYKGSVLSALRFAVDLVMAFLVFVLLMSGLGFPGPDQRPSGLASVPPQNPIVILTAISAWHVGATLWHVLASYDHGLGAPRRIAFLPHIIFAGVYWLIYAVSYGGWIPVSREGLLSLIGGAILAMSMMRWYHVIKSMP
jgi:hypothetical protein